MRRTGSSEISSLDLLLDTICNTFGGIVFIALLLALLSQSAGKAASVSPEKQRRKMEVARMEQEVADLAETVAALEQNILKSDQTPSEPRSTLDAELASVLATNAVLDARIKELTQHVQQQTEAMGLDAQAGEALDRQIQQVRRQIREIAITAPRFSSPAGIRRLPRVDKAPAGLQHMWFAVHKGRLYWLDGRDPAVMETICPNEYWLYEVNSARGQLICPGCEQEGIFSMVLNQMPSQRYVLRFMVDVDSFSEFNYIKGVIVSRGYRYMFNVSSAPYFLTVGTPTDAM